MADYYWKLKVQSPSKRKGYDPSQPRVPAGQTTGGQWTSGGGGQISPQNTLERFISGHTPTTDYRQKGFLVPNGEFYAVINHPLAAEIALGERAPKGAETALAQFLIKTKTVRITGNGSGVEIVAPVTRAQRDVLETMPHWKRNPMRVDISNTEGRNLASFNIDSPEDMRALLKAVPRILSEPAPRGGWESMLRWMKQKKQGKSDGTDG